MDKITLIQNIEAVTDRLYSLYDANISEKDLCALSDAMIQYRILQIQIIKLEKELNKT